MKDTSYILPEDKFDRLVSVSQRKAGGPLIEQARQLPVPPKTFNGGGGLYSTPEDYVRFMQMFLRRGRAGDGSQVLQRRPVEMMMSDQTGGLSAGKLKTSRPETSSDVISIRGSRTASASGFS
jgi:CubicO group peptidase (beta-lactamase class C family)